MTIEKKLKSSPDYPRLAREVLEASGKESISKLPAGLYVVATPIGHRGDISLRALITLAHVDFIAAEDTRTTGSLLTSYGIKGKFLSYHDHNEAERIPLLLEHMRSGSSVALVSDAGLPLISDPGFRLVEACRQESVEVTVIPGANAALTALVGSGLATHQFHFIGFLPPKAGARQKVIDGIKSLSASVLFYETAPRLLAALEDLRRGCGPLRRAVVARELTKLHEEFKSGTLEELVNHFKANPTKGEIVIVLAEPLAREALSSDSDLDDLLKKALETETLRDAVTLVSGATGRKKNEVYARALWLSKTGPVKSEVVITSRAKPKRD